MFYSKSDGNSNYDRKCIRVNDCSRVTTWSQVTVNCSILEVKAGTFDCPDGSTKRETMDEALRWMLSVLEDQSEMEE